MSQPAFLIVTHAGAFHSDELMAIALLDRFYFHRPLRLALEWSAGQIGRAAKQGQPGPMEPVRLADGVEDCRQPNVVVRTRDPKALANARGNPGVFVIDVGGEFDPDRLNFDHHQASMDLAWPDGTPLSSAGLVWRWLKEQGCLSRHLPEQALRELEHDLIIPLDAHDNGVVAFPDAGVCEGFNRNGVDPDQVAGQFRKALDFVSNLLDNAIYRVTSKLESRQAIQAAWEKSPDPRFAVLGSPITYPQGTALLAEVSQGQALLLGLPSKGDRYNLVSTSLEGRFSIACPMPESWRGRMDFDAEVPGGPPVRIAFAHKTGFMCVFDGDKGLAERVAQSVVDSHLATQPRAGRGRALHPGRAGLPG